MISLKFQIRWCSCLYFRIILNTMPGSLVIKEVTQDDLPKINPKVKYLHALECGIGENLYNPECL